MRGVLKSGNDTAEPLKPEKNRPTEHQQKATNSSSTQTAEEEEKNKNEKQESFFFFPLSRIQISEEKKKEVSLKISWRL